MSVAGCVSIGGVRTGDPARDAEQGPSADFSLACWTDLCAPVKALSNSFSPFHVEALFCLRRPRHLAHIAFSWRHPSSQGSAASQCCLPVILVCRYPLGHAPSLVDHGHSAISCHGWLSRLLSVVP